MKTEMEVKSFKRTSDKPGSWLQIETLGKEGAVIKKMIKDESISKVVEGCGIGVYDAELTKNGKYWDITGMNIKKPASTPNAAPNVTQAAGTTPAPVTIVVPQPRTFDSNVLMQNRCISDQVCVKAAADIVVAVVNKGGFEDMNSGELDLMQVNEWSMLLARGLIGEIKKDLENINPKSKVEGA